MSMEWLTVEIRKAAPSAIVHIPGLLHTANVAQEQFREVAY